MNELDDVRLIATSDRRGLEGRDKPHANRTDVGWLLFGSDVAFSLIMMMMMMTTTTTTTMMMMMIDEIASIPLCMRNKYNLHIMRRHNSKCDHSFHARCLR